MLEILRVPRRDGLVQPPVRDVRVPVPRVPVAQEGQVARLARRAHRLDDEVRADEALPRLDHVGRGLEVVLTGPARAAGAGEEVVGEEGEGEGGGEEEEEGREGE